MASPGLPSFKSASAWSRRGDFGTGEGADSWEKPGPAAAVSKRNNATTAHKLVGAGDLRAQKTMVWSLFGTDFPSKLTCKTQEDARFPRIKRESAIQSLRARNSIGPCPALSLARAVRCARIVSE